MTTRHPIEPYQSDDDHPTLTFAANDQTLALPYHLVRSLELGRGEKRIDIDYDDYQVRIEGAQLVRLWRELRAFRVKEVSINGGKAAQALGERGERCLVQAITISRKQEVVPEA